MADKYSQLLGLGDQSLGDFMSLSDTPTLRNKYYSMLDEGLGEATQPAEMDQANMLWQGIIPALATALITKGKSFKFSGLPLQGVYDREQKRAETNRQFSVEAKLTGAGLISDTLEKRDALVAAAASKAEDRATREATADQAHEDRMMLAGMASADRRYAANLLHEDRQASNADRDEKRRKDTEFKLQSDFRAEANKAGLQKSASAIEDVDTLLNGPQNAITQGQLATKAVKMAGDVGNIGLKERAMVLPTTAQSKVLPWINWIEGGADPTLAPATIDGFKILTSLYKGAVAEKVNSLRQEFKSVYGENPPIDKADFDRIIDNLGSSYIKGGKKSELTPQSISKAREYLSTANPFGSSAPSASSKFKTKNGVRTLEELRQVPGWSDDMLQQLEKAE